MQKEILQGNFTLRISDKLPSNNRIELYALEPVAYFLHKKRDFLERLHSKKEFFDRKELIEYQNNLKLLAGDSPEGKARKERIERRRVNALDMHGIYVNRDKQSYFKN